MQNLMLLDCTLRDGGYINDWKWGFEGAKSIVQLLVKSGIDIIEVGFLRNVDEYNPDITVCNYIEELNRLLPKSNSNVIFSAMAMRSNYDLDKLTNYNGTGIELIRVTAHDYDIEEGLVFAQKVQEKGYKVSINPINIMGYSDEQLIKILKKVNEIQPYQFSIVDTFGSMKRRDLDRIVSLVDNNLSPNIRVALHLHENMSLSTSLAQQFVDKHLNRPTSIDGSLMGMGRVPGNLPIELIADYLNEYLDKAYDIDYMMDAIQDYIAPIKKHSEWGYLPAYFLSARYNLHRNYAEHYLEKGDLTNRDINRILAGFDRKKATAFDKEYADECYKIYKNNIIDDAKDIIDLRTKIGGKDVLVLAPGNSLNEYTDLIKEYIQDKKPIVISVNSIPEMFAVDYSFFSNSKRCSQIVEGRSKIIVTSNIKDVKSHFTLDYNRLGRSFDQGYNSFIMLLSLLKEIEVASITVAGADGYGDAGADYYIPTMKSIAEHVKDYNLKVSGAIKKLGLNISYLTKSAYDI